jgi:hypothetical protein
VLTIAGDAMQKIREAAAHKGEQARADERE